MGKRIATAKPTAAALARVDVADKRVMREARAAWILGMNEERIEKQMSLPQGTVKRWREAHQPDDQSWYELQHMLDLTGTVLTDWEGPDTELEIRGKLMALAVRVLDMCGAALHYAKYYNEEGEEIEQVWVREPGTGEMTPVKLGGLFPTKLPQAISAMEAASRVLDVQMAKVEEIRLAREQEVGGMAVMAKEVLERLDGHIDEEGLALLRGMRAGEEVETDGQERAGAGGEDAEAGAGEEDSLAVGTGGEAEDEGDPVAEDGAAQGGG